MMQHMSRYFFFALILLIALGLLFFLRNNDSLQQEESVSTTRSEVPIIPDVPKDAIPPLDFPRYETAKATSEWLFDDDVILGVSFDGDARAYPIKILNWHEIVNEEIAGIPLVITYCPLCNSGVVFDRRLNGEELSFGNTGALFESALVMYDRETESYWYHVAGEAIKGELLGKRLEILPSNMMRWRQWREKHPETQVLSIDTGFRRNYLSNSYEGYDRLDSRPAFPVSSLDERLFPKERVVGIVIDGESKAYPPRLLKGQTIQDSVGGEAIEVVVNETGDSAEIFFVSEGERMPAPVTNAFWFAWALSYPETAIYEG